MLLRTKLLPLLVVPVLLAIEGRISAQDLPALLTKEFVPGTYDDGDTRTCTLGVNAALGSRIAGTLLCKSNQGRATFSANWVTGPIAGHPFESDLVASGIDKITGAENVAWGKGSSIGCCAYCFNGTGIISVHQAGNVLAINKFGNDNIIDCTHSF